MNVKANAKPIPAAVRVRRGRPLVKEPRVGRNEPCVCGSGRKSKVCCGADS